MSESASKEIGEAIRRFYGSLMRPRFERVVTTIESSHYEQLLDELVSAEVSVVEDTDPNDDVSFGLLLSKAGERLIVRISMVGAYAVLMRVGTAGRCELIEGRQDVQSTLEQVVLQLLNAHELRVLGHEVLCSPVRLRLFNTNPDRVFVYQALFTDSDGLPWESHD